RSTGSGDFFRLFPRVRTSVCSHAARPAPPPRSPSPSRASCPRTRTARASRPGSPAASLEETPMPIGKRLLVFSPDDPKATALVARTAEWGCLVSTCETVEDLRGRLEGGQFDMVLVQESAVLRRLCAEADPTGDILRTPLAEIEKRHILRVLSSTGGNKTRAAKILGI